MSTSVIDRVRPRGEHRPRSEHEPDRRPFVELTRRQRAIGQFHAVRLWLGRALS